MNAKNDMRTFLRSIGTIVVGALAALIVLVLFWALFIGHQ